MLKKYISLIIFFFSTGFQFMYAQSQRVCTTPEYDKYLRAKSPAYAKERDEMESKIASFKEAHAQQRNSAATLVIPVVVHVLWKTSAQNVSDEQIISQIDVLNEDYSITNANIAEVPSVWAGLVGSSHIIFSLARRDGNNQDTSGIVRVHTNEDFFTTGDEVKHSSTGGSDAWDRNHFLNIWVCNLKGGAGSQDILGYAQLPSNSNAETDGIVINFQAFGRLGFLKDQYDLGRTATHEIGHWLNLVHTWGDDNGLCVPNGGNGDFIDDTPDQADATYGCPGVPVVSCGNGPEGNMFQNYMDYTDDRCMMLFTADQRSRMNNAITFYRDTLEYAADYAQPVNPPATDIKISALKPDKDALGNVVCGRYIVPVITIRNAGTNTVTSFSIKYGVDHDTTKLFDWSGTLLPGNNLDITLGEVLISEDLHILIVNINSVNGGKDDYTPDNFRTRGFLFTPALNGCIQYPETPEIVISPNLASDDIIIESKYKEAQKATLSIYNILGKRVYTTDYSNSSGELLSVDVKGLANGIYFVEVKTFNKQSCTKFVISHP